MEVSDFLKVSVITTFYTMKFFNIPKLLHVHKKLFHTKKNIQIPCIKIFVVGHRLIDNIRKNSEK